MLTLTDPCCTLKLLRWRWVIKVTWKRWINWVYVDFTALSVLPLPTSPPCFLPVSLTVSSAFFCLRKQIAESSFGNSLHFSLDVTQSSLPFFSPLPLQFWLTYVTHALFVFVYFIFAVRRRRDSSNLLWNLSRHTWLPPFIYAHIFAKWCSVGQTLLFSPWLKIVLSLTGFRPQMVRCKLWIRWH